VTPFTHHTQGAKAERNRLEQAGEKKRHWRRWGPYLSERAWGTVREDYSPYGTAWDYFPHDHARSRAYRWSEDGLLGICDNHQRLCFGLSVWNGRDPILKERLYGLAGPEGNHGEDVKELYYYLDSTPTHSYMKALYKYPQAAFPYQQIIDETRRRGQRDPEFELIDTGIFDNDRYFDIFVEYAKADVNDLVARITIHNRASEAARLHVMPTVWFRNTWSWKPGSLRPQLRQEGPNLISIHEPSLGPMALTMHGNPEMLFTENDTNTERFWNYRSGNGFYKDAFHEYLIHGRTGAVNPELHGTKACGLYVCDIPAHGSYQIRVRLSDTLDPIEYQSLFLQRIAEAEEFYSFCPSTVSGDGRNVQRQAFAGMLWSKQYYHYVVEDWLKGDVGQPPPPEGRKKGRNRQWSHLYNADVISMPDKWEYPWYAAWDTAFHMIPFALIDPEFAKAQLQLFLREWYMHPNGQLPAYEWAFEDVNPPVHAWACWRVYKIDAKLQGAPDLGFLERVFHKLLMNFTWWVNRKDSEGNNIFEGGFLGLDNIGVFDRSKPLPTGGNLEQSDGTSWMAMYCLNMLKMALELAQYDSNYEDIASKFFEHFLHIGTAMNSIGGEGLWDEHDGFYYDMLRLPHGERRALKIRSMVGLIPIFAVDTLEPEVINRLPGFKRRMEWFLANRADLCGNVSSGLTKEGEGERRLLSIVGRTRLVPILRRMLDEAEFLSSHGVRSISRCHKDHPYILQVNGSEYRVDYDPAESSSGMFGGNSNWRGPVWFPVNYLLIESLQKFHHYYGDDLKVEFPYRSGKYMNLWNVAGELSRRLSRLFLHDVHGRRPFNGTHEKLQSDPHFRDLILFYEYFHAETGAGLGASHQTGWTGLVAKLLQQSGE
jgi:hypothetical protein